MKIANGPDDVLPRFKLSNFRSGDILLSTVQRGAMSAAIRVATRSRFSHAAIHWRSFTFLEAIGVGVCPFNALGSAISERKNIQVLRLKDEHGSEFATRAADAAYAMIGREYWVRGAIRALVGIGLEDVRGRLFCSHLVAEAYALAGLQLCPGKNPRFVTPGDLSSSPLLRDITDSVLYEAAEHELQGLVRLIDGHDPSTPQTEFRGAIERLMVQVRATFTWHEMPTPMSLSHAMELLLQVPDQSKQRTLDNELAELLENARYSELPTVALSREPVVGFDEQELMAASLETLTATISTHRAMLREWIARNVERKDGIDQARRACRGELPFKVLELQARHESAHCSVMEASIAALGRDVRLMERIRSERLRSGGA